MTTPTAIPVASLAQATWGECLVPPVDLPAEVKADLKRIFGLVPGWAYHFWPKQWFMEFQKVPFTLKLDHASHRLLILLTFTVTVQNSCRYCYGTMGAMLRVLGLSWDEIHRLEQDISLAKLTAPERAAIQLARKVAQSNPRLSHQDLCDLEATGFTKEAAREAALIAAYMSCGNRMSSLMQLPLEQELEKLVRSSLFALLRPILQRVIFGKRTRLQTPRQVPARHPFGRLIDRIEGLQLGLVFDRLLNACWSDGPLPLRTRTLMFAVIGKALGCQSFRQELWGEMLSTGLTEGEIEDIVNNLASPALDDRESRLIPLARQTVQYRTHELNERAAKALAGLSRDEVMDAIGIVSLANAVFRLSALLDEC